jgi:gamma-glutamylcyclotransferase (GGCT)/AIG2-like uncharacterized protein YtfP
MSDHLFVYGTLQAGLGPPEIAHAVERLKPVGRATVRGVLYDFGHYPGAVLDPSSERAISGMVLQLPADPSLLALLDKYEEFDSAAPETSQFLRVRETITLESGRKLECWIYVYNRDTGSAPVLAQGRFSTSRC